MRRKHVVLITPNNRRISPFRVGFVPASWRFALLWNV